MQKTENAEQKKHHLAITRLHGHFKTDIVNVQRSMNRKMESKVPSDGQGWRGDTSYQPDLEKHREPVSGYCG